MNRDDAIPHPVEALSALLDGELDGPARRAVESHLEACEGCRGLIEDLKTLDRAVAAEPAPATPPDLARRIAAALPERAAMPPPVPAFGRRSWFRAPMPLAAAASLTVATLVWLAWPGGSPRIEAPAGDAPPAASIPATPPPAAGGDRVSDEATMVAPPPPPPPPPSKAAEKGSRPAVESSPLQERRRQAPAAPDTEPPERVEETSGFSDAARDDRGDEPGVAGRVLGGTVEAPAESVEEGSVGTAASPEAKDKEARSQVSEQRAAETERLGVPGRTPQDLPPPAPGVSEADAGIFPMALRAEPYVVRLLPGDAMRVESDGYACTIDLLPEDAQRLAEEYAALRQAGMATASAAGSAAAGPASAQPPAAGSPSAAQSAAAPSAPPSRPTDSGDTRPVSAKASAIKKEARLVVETSPEGRALILMLVRERYRSALAERCGPPPR